MKIICYVLYVSCQMKCSKCGYSQSVAKPLVYLKMPNWLFGEIEVEDKSFEVMK